MNMTNSYIIAGVVVILVIAGILFFGRKTDAPVPEVESEAVVGKALEDGSYTLDIAQSVVGWQGEFVTGLKKHDGTVKIKSGNVVVEGGIIKSGSFEIDMQTVVDNENTERLITHLKSDDFFSVATYPTAKFEITSFAPVNEKSAELGRYVVGGNLTIKGITKPISFLTTISSTETGLKASSSFAINRADWEVRYGSTSFFQGLGDKAIRDAVQIGLELTASQQD